MCVQIWVKDIKDVPQFSDYKGALGDFESGVEYFLNLFLSVNESPDKVGRQTITCLLLSLPSKEAGERLD